jgi:hypothetical protein
MKLYETESLSEKQRDKLTSYFKLAKKLKEFQNGCTSCYDSPIRRKEGDRLWVSLQANVIETLICGLLTCAQNKRYILGTNSEIRKSLQGIIWRNINRQHYV